MCFEAGRPDPPTPTLAHPEVGVGLSLLLVLVVLAVLVVLVVLAVLVFFLWRNRKGQPGDSKMNPFPVSCPLTLTR